MASSDSLRPTLNTRQHPPHIRLNSGTDNILTQELTDQQRSGLSREQTRTLTPQSPAAHYAIGGSAADSAELLLPPQKSRVRRFRDESPASPLRSPTEMSYASSRRSSWSSESAGSRSSRMGPFASPFDDSRAPSRAGSDDEGVNTQTVSEKYNILPSAGLLLFPEDVEKDDWLHNPDPNDKDRDCDIWNKRGMLNVGGLALVTLGVLILFIGYPVLYVDVVDDGYQNANTLQDFCKKRHRQHRRPLHIRSNVYRPGS